MALNRSRRGRRGRLTSAGEAAPALERPPRHIDVISGGCQVDGRRSYRPITPKQEPAPDETRFRSLMELANRLIDL
ncbi:hypothetical protein MTP99_016041 [Tenebrio molitor]|nr:hypothetical protein MTP99_016041 [Tenebrio molitor]